MAKPRKKKGAPPPEALPAAPDPAPAPASAQAEAPLEEFEEVPPPPPVQRPGRPIAQVAAMVEPRTAEDIMHNVLVRQIIADIKDPPPPYRPNPALATLEQVGEARDRGELVAPLQEEIARRMSASDTASLLTRQLYLSYRRDKLTKYLIADDKIDQALLRAFDQAEMTPAELLVMKKMVQTEIGELARELTQETKGGATTGVILDATEVVAKLDYRVQLAAQDTSKELEGTTPMGREIIRKILFEARRVAFGT